LKIITFIKSEKINTYFEQLKTYINNRDDEEKVLFNKFMKYYSKTWLKTQFIHFDLTYNENMTCRTNNLYEAFHNSLTYSIEHSKPKMAIFVESMIKIVKTNFNNSVSNLVKINNNI
jgi:hypothetical protein